MVTIKNKTQNSGIFTGLITWYFSRKALPYWAVLIMDCLDIVMASVIAVYVISGGDILAHHFWDFVLMACCSLPLMAVGMRCMHTYSGVLRYSSFVDLARCLAALLIGVALNFVAGMGVVSVVSPDSWFTQTVTLIHWDTCIVGVLVSVMFMWGIRIIVKFLFDTVTDGVTSQRVFIFGTREGGISLAKSMRNEHPIKYKVRGFSTNREEAWGKYVVGVPIYRPDELVTAMQNERAKILFVSPLCSEYIRESETLVKSLTKAGIKIMMVPSQAEAWDGKSKLNYNQLREVDIEDLLPRDKIQVDLDEIAAMLQGKSILVTGAAGSIGYEMTRQIAKFKPSCLLLVDQAETPMHTVRLHMAKHYPDLKCITVVSSITNQTKMECLFSKYKPDYVFHAAAYKHVPMMEDNPAEAVQNNIYGTRVIADLAVKYGTRKFVMISTDKAVNPTNVMGCSKRICEIYCQALSNKLWEQSQKTGEPVTQFITTRFGNVLGSNGSVIPIFKKQIAQGGPVTVTHPDIIRFFMLIPEACQLVLEAGTMGIGGEIFVFDMGKPVRIADLAQRMIDLSGAKNVEIKFTGLRDGEKLYEEVLNDAEQTKPVEFKRMDGSIFTHNKIKVAKVREYPYDLALKNEEELYKLSFSYDDMAIVAKMKEIVPEYRSQHSKYEALDKKCL